MRHLPAWIIVTAAAAVLLALWAAYARRYWHALRYSMRRARHLADLTQTEVIPGAEYIGAMMAEDEPWLTAPPVDPDPWLTRRVPDWREQTRAALSPEALAALPPREFLTTVPGTRMTIYTDGEIEFTDPPDDSGPGGGADWSSPDSPAAPGPDRYTITVDGPIPWGPASIGHIHNGSCASMRCWDGGPGREAEPGPDWLEVQLALTFDWVRAMVPQVTGWSVAA